MRFHLVDRIDAYEPFRLIRARKLTSHTEDHWEDDADGPRMADPLVLESLLQAGTWLVVLSTEARRRAVLASIGSVRFLGSVRPGDILDLEATVVTADDDAWVLSGRLTVGGVPIVEANDVMCVLADAGDLEDDEETQRMADLLTRKQTGA